MDCTELRSKKNPGSGAEKFYQDIYSQDSFKLILAIRNHAKHVKPIQCSTETTYGLPVNEWSDFLSVQNVFDGPPSGYKVDGQDVLVVIEAVIKFYDENWFAKSRQ
jgi:hypothetical protein